MNTFAANQGLKYQIIKCYLLAIRHLQIECGGGDPRVQSMPLVVLALRGTKLEQAGLEKRTRLPITQVILEQLRRVWSQGPSNPDHAKLWAVCCGGFFGFLRSGEMTAPEVGEIDPGQHLSFPDITVDDVENPWSVAVRIKQSKTDSFRQGLSIVLSRIAALLAHLVVRGNSEGPLFLLRGKPLRRPKLVLKLRKAVAGTGLQPEKYARHSFWIGAITTTAVCGVPVDIIKTLGRWKSKAYQLYVRIPNAQLASITKSLVGARVCWAGRERCRAGREVGWEGDVSCGGSYSLCCVVDMVVEYALINK